MSFSCLISLSLVLDNYNDQAEYDQFHTNLECELILPFVPIAGMLLEFDNLQEKIEEVVYVIGEDYFRVNLEEEIVQKTTFRERVQEYLHRGFKISEE